MTAYKFVGKPLEEDICEDFQNDFTLIEHEKETRIKNRTLQSPSINKEYVKFTAVNGL